MGLRWSAVLGVELGVLLVGGQVGAQVPRRPEAGTTTAEVARLVEEASSAVTSALGEPDEDVRRSILIRAAELADSAIVIDSTSVDAHYWRAAARGVRTEIDGGRTRVELAAAVHEDAMWILAVDPDHAGAHHLMGRLHAGVERLNFLTRFVALRLMGGGALSGASWESAEAHFRAAMEADPEAPEHRYELAAVLADTDRDDEAREMLLDLLASPGDETTSDYYLEKARRLLDEMNGG